MITINVINKRYSVQKNRVRSAVSNKHSSVDYEPLPDVVNIDELAVAHDEELINRLRSLEEARSYSITRNYNPRPWEEELCYVLRELQIRRARREAWEHYSRAANSSNKDDTEPEEDLPFADLDNSKFMRAAGEIN